ncbi:MAG: SLC13 family permease [Phycisphaeraceae bacterium]
MSSSVIRSTALLLGPLAGLLVYALCAGSAGLSAEASVTAGVTMLCAVWWCTEAIPIPATALIPFAVFPFAGVLDHGQLAVAYGDKFVLLFMAGFMLSRAAERSGTHLQVAHGVMRLVGAGSPRRVVVGFMLATAFCSMWISNTATALIMLPVAMAVIERSSQEDEGFSVSLLLAIAYGASIGGMATLVGTPPNGVLAAVYETSTDRTMDFLSWMTIGTPVSVLMLVACALVLCWNLRSDQDLRVDRPGYWTPGQWRVLLVLGLTAAGWITRSLPFGLGGWSVWLEMPMAHDATVGLLAVVAMFLIPAGGEAGRGKKLLDWETAAKIPWGVLILFGGGLALAKAFVVTGLDGTIGEALAGLGGYPTVVVIGGVCLSVTFLTELTSNTATTTLLMPIVASLAVEMGYDPLMLMVPAALSASCAFMLPVATPPNAIVFGGSERLTIGRMARKGLVLNLIGVVVITVMCSWVLNLG